MLCPYPCIAQARLAHSKGAHDTLFSPQQDGKSILQYAYNVDRSIERRRHGRPLGTDQGLKGQPGSNLPALLDTLAPLVGLLLRGREAAVV